MRNFYPLLGVGSSFDPWNRHVTSPVLAPLSLAILRLTIAVYTLVTLIITLVHDCVLENTGSRCVLLTRHEIAFHPIFLQLLQLLHTSHIRRRLRLLLGCWHPDVDLRSETSRTGRDGTDGIGHWNCGHGEKRR